MMSKEELYERLKVYLQELFEIPEEDIVPEARLVEDLDLDSIDAVDLIVKLQELTGQRVSQEAFKSVRTVRDVIDTVHDLLAA